MHRAADTERVKLAGKLIAVDAKLVEIEPYDVKMPRADIVRMAQRGRFKPHLSGERGTVSPGDRHPPVQQLLASLQLHQAKR